MKHVLLIILICLIFVGSVSAILEPVSAPLKQPISEAAKPSPLASPCSDDPFPDFGPDWGMIWLKNWTNGEWRDCYPCTVVIDGHPPNSLGHTIGYFSSYEAEYKFVEESGTHSYKVFIGAGNETGTISVCGGKITYIYANKPLPAVTTQTTAAVTGTVTTMPVTTITTAPTTVTTQEITKPSTTTLAGTATAQPDPLGALSVTTTPAGAFIFIDGVQRGVSPATIPGLSAGIHTLLLKLDGYQDLSTPVTIAAGSTQDYSSALVKNAETGTTRSPGFEFVSALFVLGAIILMRIRS